MMEDITGLERGRSAFDGTYPSRLGEPGDLDVGIEPLIEAVGDDGVRLRANDQVGWPLVFGLEAPGAREIRPVDRSGHVRGVAPRRTGIHPRDDRFDLLVAEGHVALELLDRPDR